MAKHDSSVAHKWAHRVVNKRTKRVEGKYGNIFYVGDKIYSYGRHFCMARLLPNDVVIIGTHTYSSTTGRHQSEVRHAVSHMRQVFCYDPDDDAWRNRDRAKGNVDAALAESKTKRRVHEITRLESILSAAGSAERFNEYLKALPKEERGAVKPLKVPSLTPEQQTRLVELRAVRRQKQEERDAARSARWAAQSAKWKQQREEEAERRKTRIPDWRAHNYHGDMYDLPTMLRLSKDGENVETSKGADIPVSHAKRLWPVIENVRALKKAYRAFGEEGGRRIKLGHYELESIEENGDIVVGCHNIAYSEIELIAQQLGLLEATV